MAATIKGSHAASPIGPHGGTRFTLPCCGRLGVKDFGKDKQEIKEIQLQGRRNLSGGRHGRRLREAVSRSCQNLQTRGNAGMFWQLQIQKGEPCKEQKCRFSNHM
jgi:hypothetical protein